MRNNAHTVAAREGKAAAQAMASAGAIQKLKDEDIEDRVREARAILAKEGIGKKPAPKARREASEQQPSAYEVAFTIAINALYNRIRALNRPEVESPFESGLQGDADAGWAMELVTREVTDMLSRTCDAQQFENWLSRMDGVIGCAHTSLTNKDSFYARQLESLKKAIEVFGEMVDEAAHHGSKFLQREVAV